MELTVDSATPAWPQVFRQFIVTNSYYWLNCAQSDRDRLWRELPQVLQGLSYSLFLAEAWKPSRDLILQLSPQLIHQGRGGEWETFLKQAIHRSAEENDPVEIELCLQLGNMYRLQGRLAEAAQHFQQGLKLCEQYHSKTHYRTLLNNLALVARQSGRPEEALAYGRQVLDERALTPSEQAEALNVMGLVAYDRRQWDEALAYFEQALGLYQTLGDAYQMARILTNQGVVLQRSGRLDEAEQRCREAIQQFHRAGDHVELYKAIMNLGNVFLGRKEYEAAIQQYQKALPVFKKCNLLIDLANAYNNMGMAYTNLSQWPAAEGCFEASLEIGRHLPDRYSLANFLDNYGAMLIKANRQQQAAGVLAEALTVLSSLAGSPAAQRLQGVIQDRLSQLAQVA